MALPAPITLSSGPRTHAHGKVSFWTVRCACYCHSALSVWPSLVCDTSGRRSDHRPQAFFLPLTHWLYIYADARRHSSSAAVLSSGPG